MTGRTFALGICVVICACTSTESDEPRARRCERLRDHLVDIRIAQTGGVDQSAHRAAMQQALGDRFLTGCANNLSERQLDCAFKATDATSAAACSSTVR